MKELEARSASKGELVLQIPLLALRVPNNKEMMFVALLTLFLAADPVPVAGRPVDFSGAVGGPFEVVTTATPTEPLVGHPITFKMRITGPGDLKQLKRPDLERDPEFLSRFTVEDDSERELTEPDGREFFYKLRARSAEVKVIPRVKFVYFNPNIKPTERGFQTAYADEILITPWKQEPTVVVPQHIHDWSAKFVEFEVHVDSLMSMSWFESILYRLGIVPPSIREQGTKWLIPLLWLLPPLACTGWIISTRAWRRRQTDTVQAHALEQLGGEFTDNPRQIGDAIRKFVEARANTSLSHSTSEEISKAQFTSDVSPQHVAEACELLRECERRRFGRQVHGDTAEVVQRAITLVSTWQASK